MAKIFASQSGEISEREKRNMQRSRKIAAQGMVLLENKGVLPLTNTGRIALFGNGGRRTVKGGTGSGDVNSRFVVNVEQGLKEAGFTIVTEEWLEHYDVEVETAREEFLAERKREFDEKGFDVLWKVLTEPFVEPPITGISDGDLENADTDTAIYVLSRNSGEGKDRIPGAGDYELYDAEKEAIRKLAEHYENVIVVLNVGGVIDTKFLRSTEGIGAILLMSQAGNIGGYALADVLTGKVTPSGHLTTTWAENYEDYPGAKAFSHVNGDINDEYYREGIYVGYRYFDSFHVTPAYPFGYGRSYTEFKVETKGVEVTGGKISVAVCVTNTGDTYKGKEVVQVYYSAPQGSLEKPYQELAAYAKTKELAPGESEELTIAYPVTSMASYDSGRASYVLEAGTYYVRVGTHSRNTTVAAAVTLDREVVTEVLKNLLPLDCEMEELSAKGVTAYRYDGEEEEKASAVTLILSADDIATKQAVYSKANEPLTVPDTAETITMSDVAAGKASLEDLAAQLSVAEMAELCVGTARGDMGGDSVIGIASVVIPGAAGDTTSCLKESRKVENMILADGPAGLRLSRTFKADADGNILLSTMESPLPGLEKMFEDLPKPEIPEDAVDYYQYCTAIPIATLLAQTWDLELIQEAGDIVGEEMEEFGVTLWLAPGMNIHRNPLCGRNFEYYSEDPLVSGMCAAADTLGVQAHSGVGTTIKHFAFNNQEDNRMHVNSHIGERAIREIYLKGFEIAVKASQPMSIMSSYNLINGTHTANSRDLLTAIARDEWGFAGMIMTDWGTTGSIEMTPGEPFKYGASSAAGCIAAGNDLTMPGSQADVNEICASVGAKEGEVRCPITLADLQACALRMLSLIRQSSGYENAVPYQADQTGYKGYIDVAR